MKEEYHGAVRNVLLLALVAGLTALGCESGTSEQQGGSTASGVGGNSGGASNSSSGGSGGSSNSSSSSSSNSSSSSSGGGYGGAGGGGAAPIVSTAVITNRHRFIDGVMFGGWGPHLGHLVRSAASQGGGDTLWLVDDYCAQPGDSGAGCDVQHDHTIGYFELTPSGWLERHTVSIPGQVQQNTGTIASANGSTIHSYGVDVGGSILRECSYEATSGPLGCISLPFSLGPSSNYIGAAISPQGYRVVWWTGVVNGGGGSFHYIVDYGGGWNGPRSGGAAGYNDASYINIAFGSGAESNKLTMHVQLVSGVAPNWSFLGAVGYGDLSTTDPVSWANVLAPLGADPMISTNDIWVDPASNDTHLVARSKTGSAVYFHRPKGGNWSPPSHEQKGAYRARFLVSAGRLMLLYGKRGGGLGYRVAAAADRKAGSPINWGALAEQSVTLPAGFGNVVAIYPESPAYQTAAANQFHAAVVGATEQNIVVHVAINLGT